MGRRSRDWNEGLAEDLRDRQFAGEFVRAAIEEGASVQAALGKVVRAYGLTEYASLAGMAAPNVSRAINPRHNPTLDTLNRLLAPIHLRLSVESVAADGTSRAA
ncbi:MAG: transcriptional regulator [Armatimonadetes bacterium]|nr:transcriptional regulator [Armatimonadota bacterium]